MGLHRRTRWRRPAGRNKSFDPLRVQVRARGDEIGVFLAASPAHEAGSPLDPARDFLDGDFNLLVFGERKCSSRLQNAILVNGLDGNGHDRTPEYGSSVEW